MKKSKKLFTATFFLHSFLALALGSKAPNSTSGPLPSKYAHLDPKHLVPREMLNAAVEYFDGHQNQIANKNYLTVIDFSKYSGQRRFFVIDMGSGEVEALHTAHGKGSDADNNGYAETFSNNSGSNMSSLGFYLTGGTYQGDNGYSLYLDGLSATNSRARDRAIVVHGADYVNPGYSQMGRSWGCPALPRADVTRIINKIKNKSLIYAAI